MTVYFPRIGAERLQLLTKSSPHLSSPISFWTGFDGVDEGL